MFLVRVAPLLYSGGLADYERKPPGCELEMEVSLVTVYIRNCEPVIKGNWAIMIIAYSFLFPPRVISPSGSRGDRLPLPTIRSFSFSMFLSLPGTINGSLSLPL